MEMCLVNVEVIISKFLGPLEKAPFPISWITKGIVVHVMHAYVKCLSWFLAFVSHFLTFAIKTYIWVMFIPLYLMEFVFGELFISLVRTLVFVINFLPGGHHIHKAVHGQLKETSNFSQDGH